MHTNGKTTDVAMCNRLHVHVVLAVVIDAESAYAFETVKHLSAFGIHLLKRHIVTYFPCLRVHDVRAGSCQNSLGVVSGM